MADHGIEADEHIDESRPMKRMRVTAACEACRSKKVKCDGKKPSESTILISCIRDWFVQGP